MDTAWVVALALGYAMPVATIIIIHIRLKKIRWLDDVQRGLNAQPRLSALLWILPALAGLAAIAFGIALLELYSMAGWASIALGTSGLLLSDFYIRIITRPFPADSGEADQESLG